MSDESATSQFDEILRDLIDRRNVRQAIAAVKSSNPSVDWIGSAAASSSGLEEPSPDTPFFMASIDKLLNATIVMMLSEKGTIDIDERIVDLLPSDVSRGLHVMDGTDYTAEITVRHLLTHTSGLPDWLEDSPRRGRSLVAQILEDGDRSLTFEQVVRVVSEDLTPYFPPQDLSGRRAKIRYSDTNFILLIRIIERVTGQPLHDVHRDLLYEPIGMTHTYFPGDSQPLDPTPPPMPLLADGEPIEIPKLMRFLRGIYSTAGDMDAFMRQLMAGAVFEHPETVWSMTRHWRSFRFLLGPAALRSPTWPIEYGKGIMRFQLPRLFTAMRRLPAVVGHTGSTGCWLFYCPEYDAYLTGSVDEVTAAGIPYRVFPRFLQVIRESRE